MSSKELLLKEVEDLGPLEVLQLRKYLHELKTFTKKVSVEAPPIDMTEIRRSLSTIKGSMSDFIANERNDRL